MGSLIARFLLREKLKGVEQLAVGKHLVMQVVAGRTSGVPDVADHVAAIDPGALLDRVVEQMPITGLQAETMVEDNQVSIAALIAHMRDGSRRRRKDRLPAFTGDIKPGM